MISAPCAINFPKAPLDPDGSSRSKSLLRDQLSQERSYHSSYERVPITDSVSAASVRSMDGWSSFDTTPFGSIGDLGSDFTTTILSGMSHMLMPNHTISHYGQHVQADSASYTSPSTFQQSSDPDNRHQDSDEESTRSFSRKRGRPCLSRTGTAPKDIATTSNDDRRKKCLPHKQIERKYREGLNMEFERLRRAVPTLSRSFDVNVIGAAKLSKGMVLAATIEYINRIEMEKDAALDEIDRLEVIVRS